MKLNNVYLINTRHKLRISNLLKLMTMQVQFCEDCICLFLFLAIYTCAHCVHFVFMAQLLDISSRERKTKKIYIQNNNNKKIE